MRACEDAPGRGEYEITFMKGNTPTLPAMSKKKRQPTSGHP
jgi:hypothetical protein